MPESFWGTLSNPALPVSGVFCFRLRSRMLPLPLPLSLSLPLTLPSVAFRRVLDPILREDRRREVLELGGLFLEWS